MDTAPSEIERTATGRPTFGVLKLLPLLPLLPLLAPVGAQEAPTDPQAQYRRATELYEKARFDEALVAYDTAIVAGERDLANRARKGKIRSALRIAEFNLALEEARTLDGSEGADAEARTLLGDALWANGYFDEADEAYGDALEAVPGSPRSPRARFGSARSLATRGRLDEALEEALAVAAIAPDDAEVHGLVGQIYQRLNRFEEAADAYDRYNSLVPSSSETAAAPTVRAKVQLLRSFRSRQPNQIEPESAGRIHRLPFRMVDRKIVVRGRINGRSVDFVVDTGAELTGISVATARQAGVSSVGWVFMAGAGPARLGRLELGRADSIEVGSLRMRNVPVWIQSAIPNTLPEWQSEHLSPMALGLSLVVDYAKGELVLAETLPESDADVRLPMRMNRLPMVRGLINATQPAYFVVDTGGEMISISADTAASLAMPPPPRHIPLRVFGRSGLDEDAFLLPGVDLDFDEIAYRGISLAVLNLRAPSVLLGFRVGGIVGHKFLSAYRVTMDLRRGELRLERSLRAAD